MPARARALQDFAALYYESFPRWGGFLASAHSYAEFERRAAWLLAFVTSFYAGAAI